MLTLSCQNTYLTLVHFKLADDFDGHLSNFPIQIARSVDVAEGAVAHLLYQLPSLQPRISWQFALALVLFRNYPLQLLLVDLLAFLLLLLSLMCCRIVGLRSPISLIYICRRVCVAALYLICLASHHVRVGVGVVVRWSRIVVVAVLVLVVYIDGRDMRSWVVLGLVCRPPLLPCEDRQQRHYSLRQRGRQKESRTVADEVLDGL